MSCYLQDDASGRKLARRASASAQWLVMLPYTLPPALMQQIAPVTLDTIGGDDACPSCAKMAELEYERYQRFEAMKR